MLLKVFGVSLLRRAPSQPRETPEYTAHHGPSHCQVRLLPLCLQLCQVLDPLLFEHLCDVFTDHVCPELQCLCLLSHYYEGVELSLILTKIVIGQFGENFFEDLRFLALQDLLDLLCNYGGKGTLVSILVLHLLNNRYLEHIQVSLLLAKLKFHAVHRISEHL